MDGLTGVPPGRNTRYTVTLTINIGVFACFTRYIYPLQHVTRAVTFSMDWAAGEGNGLRNVEPKNIILVQCRVGADDVPKVIDRAYRGARLQEHVVQRAEAEIGVVQHKIRRPGVREVQGGDLAAVKHKAVAALGVIIAGNRAVGVDRHRRGMRKLWEGERDIVLEFCITDLLLRAGLVGHEEAGRGAANAVGASEWRRVSPHDHPGGVNGVEKGEPGAGHAQSSDVAVVPDKAELDEVCAADDLPAIIDPVRGKVEASGVRQRRDLPVLGADKRPARIRIAARGSRVVDPRDANGRRSGDGGVREGVAVFDKRAAIVVADDDAVIVNAGGSDVAVPGDDDGRQYILAVCAGAERQGGGRQKGQEVLSSFGGVHVFLSFMG